LDGVPPATADDATTAQILVIDEPERHLHSRVMRQAANWLAAFAESTETSLVVASHGTAFLALGHEVVVARVRRVDDRISIEPMSAGDRETLDRIAAELGLDRGELLTTVGCFMIVEGEHDKIVLETIFGRELRIAGVFIAPVRGTGGAGLFDSETLWRFSSAPALIVTDKLSAEIIQLTRDDPEAAIAQLAGTNVGEERALLAALKEMRETDKQLHFMGHPGADLIDALDASVVAAVHSKFPGHDTATAAYNAYASRRKEADTAEVILRARVRHPRRQPRVRAARRGPRPTQRPASSARSRGRPRHRTRHRVPFAVDALAGRGVSLVFGIRLRRTAHRLQQGPCSRRDRRRWDAPARDLYSRWP
jgi:hypothetical protein